MRKKLDPATKREHIIGIKVRKDIKEKIAYLSEVEDVPMSTYINKIIENYIDNYTKTYKINWVKILQNNEEKI